ncbi:hypothetical protein [Larkinella soli]|uniref:hypothetical protein n=1 Tax=Larkinella soli TaxID=1770527 RepID=UPI000FFB9D61|nr:hypothetical protein [Larkinella soli]
METLSARLSASQPEHLIGALHRTPGPDGRPAAFQSTLPEQYDNIPAGLPSPAIPDFGICDFQAMG